MLLIESLTTALSGPLARLHNLAVAIRVLANLALITAGLRGLLAALRPLLRLTGLALRLLLLGLRPVFSLLVAHKYPLML
jgi:hypothetical protein